MSPQTSNRSRIFISSVVKDYGDRRNAAREAIEKVGSTAVLAEELSPAAGPPPQVVLEEELCSCDTIIGVYGISYGWEGAEGGLSPTEQEYDKARELFIPIYAFIDRMEQGKREAKQERFLDKV